MNTHLVESSVEAQVFVEVQAQGDTDKSGSSPFSPSHLSQILNSTSYGLSLGVMLKCVLFALMCCSNEEEGAPFYRWRGGGSLEKRHHPHMASTKPTSRYVEPGRNHVNRLGDVGLN
jgi:hypothetical protein